MQKILSNELINLPVYTQSNIYLGRLTSFEVDIDDQNIIAYHVKTGLIKGLWHQELIIHPSQVISITLERMVAEDNVSKEPRVDLKEVSLMTPATK